MTRGGVYCRGHNPAFRFRPRIHTPESRAKISAALRGGKHCLSKEGREALQRSARKNLAASSEEKRDRMIRAWAAGKFDDRDFSPEVIEKLRQATLRQFAKSGSPFKGRKHTKEAREKMRIAHARRSHRRSKLEATFGEWLRSAGLTTESQTVVGYWSVDYTVEDGMHRFAIEVDGCYFHACKKCFPNGAYGLAAKRRANDARKDKYLKRHGWCVFRIPEHAIKKIGQPTATMVAELIKAIMAMTPQAVNQG